MAALLTWKRFSVAGQDVGTTYPANSVGRLRHIIHCLQHYAAQPDARWEVASVDSVGASPYIVMKPVSGAPGRLLFHAFSSVAGLNPNFRNPAVASMVANTGYVGFWPNGNTDTPPAPASSGAIFGDDTGTTYLSSTTHTTSIAHIAIDDTEETILFGYMAALAGNTAAWQLFGNAMQDSAGNAKGCVLSGNGQFTLSFGTSVAVPNPNVANCIAEGGATCLSGANYNSTIYPYVRDLSVPDIVFLPGMIHVINGPRVDTINHRLRQIGFSGAALAVGETIMVSSPGGPVPVAFTQQRYAVNQAGSAWLLNQII